MDVYEVVGWIGAVMVVGAYVLVTRSGQSRTYHVLNLFGAAGLLVNALHHGAIPATTLNVLWVLVAIWALGRTARARS